jgi:hypothetical protein
MQSINTHGSGIESEQVQAETDGKYELYLVFK